jgi:hypothetical protein
MLQGLPVLQRRLDSTERSPELDLILTPWRNGPSPKIDQHVPSQHLITTNVLTHVRTTRR